MHVYMCWRRKKLPSTCTAPEIDMLKLGFRAHMVWYIAWHILREPYQAVNVVVHLIW